MATKDLNKKSKSPKPRLEATNDRAVEEIHSRADKKKKTERKHTEKALKANEELSRVIIANAPIGIATSNCKYHFISANAAFCNILGYSALELRKLTFRDLCCPDDLPKSLKNMSALEKGEVKSFIDEKRYVKKDGSIITGRVNVNAIRDSNGRPILFVVELEDITKGKQLEEDLKSSEERFRAISTSAMDAIILSDKEDKILYWNPAAERMYGYLSAEAVGRRLGKLIIPLSAHRKHSMMLGNLQKSNISKREFGMTSLRKDGSEFFVDVSMVSLRVKGQNCLLSIVKDITDWKSMEDALRQERDVLESVATSTNIILAIVNREYRITWANKKAKEATGFDNNIINRHCYETFGSGSTAICEGCGVKRIFENGEREVIRDYYNTPKGRWGELITTPIKDKNGEVIAALEIAVDITERKQLQHKLAGYSQKLEEIVQKRTDELKKTQAELVKSERLAAIGELAGMIGHDLRNPLTGIKNSVYFLRKKGGGMSSQQANEMLEAIDKCVDYSNRIINDLMDYSREIHLTIQEQTLQRLLLDALSIIGIPETVTVQNKLKKAPAIPVDPDKMKRVFINLIKNAIDAMPDGGEITVASQKVGDNIEVSFTDTGSGINDEILPKIFTPLYTTKAQGMGLGLAICKRIIEAHKGTISVKTVKGQGTTFKITLPLDLRVESGGETHG